MSESDMTPQEKARRRAYHRDRAIVSKIGKEATALALDRMNEHELWLMIQTGLKAIEIVSQNGRDVELARIARDTRAAAAELYLRGHQVELWQPAGGIWAG